MDSTKVAGQLRDAASRVCAGEATADDRLLLVRVIRTAAGAKRYNRPIGSQIGGGAFKAKVKPPATRVTSQTDRALIQAANDPQNKNPGYKRQASRELLRRRGKSNLNNIDPQAMSTGKRTVVGGGDAADRALRDPKAVGSMGQDELKSADKELTRRAATLGKPGRVSPTHRKIKAALAKKPAMSKGASDVAKMQEQIKRDAMKLRQKREAAAKPRTLEQMDEAELERTAGRLQSKINNMPKDSRERAVAEELLVRINMRRNSLNQKALRGSAANKYKSREDLKAAVVARYRTAGGGK